MELLAKLVCDFDKHQLSMQEFADSKTFPLNSTMNNS